MRPLFCKTVDNEKFMCMKKISLFTLAIATGFVVFAQDEPTLRTPMESKIRFGLKGGVNLSTLHLTEDDYPSGLAPNTNMKTSGFGGVFVNIPLSTNFRLQPEVMFSSQGSKMKGGPLVISNQDESYEIDAQYINVPVMFQYQTNGGFFVEAGPQLGILMKGEKDGPDDSGSGDIDIKDNMKTTDFSLAGGIGYLSRVGLGINARYIAGLSNVWNADDNNLQFPGKAKNSVVQIGLAYHFGAAK
jgi:hypothetical protein